MHLLFKWVESACTSQSDSKVKNYRAGGAVFTSNSLSLLLYTRYVGVYAAHASKLHVVMRMSCIVSSKIAGTPFLSAHARTDNVHVNGRG